MDTYLYMEKGDALVPRASVSDIYLQVVVARAGSRSRAYTCTMTTSFRWLKPQEAADTNGPHRDHRVRECGVTLDSRRLVSKRIVAQSSYST